MEYVPKVCRSLTVSFYTIQLIVRFRDILKWPGTYNPHLSSFTSTFEDDQNGEAQIRLRNDLQVRLGTLLETFCPNLNCVQAACTMHSMCSKPLDP
jgi:hypothetical protein